MRSNKIFLAVVLILLCTGMRSIGKTVDEKTARIVGMNYLNMKGVMVPNTAALETVYTATGKINGHTVNDYYVFNVTGGHAFVIVSADDIIRPILAYSDESAFDMNKMSGSTKDWIDGYHNQVTAAIQNEVPAKSSTPGRWNDLINNTASKSNERTTAVAPLIGAHITWDQSPYYNDSCPGVGVNQSPTGCVATAMSQVMKFWNWPTVGTGYNTYSCTSYSSTPIQLSADYGNTVYDWTGMTTPQVLSPNAAVAQLMFHAGVSVEMQYDTTESGAYVLELEAGPPCSSAEYALKNYFHYSRSLKGIPRFGEQNEYGVYYVDSMSESAWIAMLQTELNAGHPIIYDGQGPIGGHCWVCDGWETTDDMFHFNWGWSGASDGYYTVDNLAPPSLGVGGGAGNFNQDQGAIIGIVPDSFANTPGNIQLNAHLNSLVSTPMDYMTPYSLSTSILNADTTTFTGDFCLQVFDTVNRLVNTVQTYTGQTINAGNTAAYTFSTTVMYNVVPMDYYHLQVMYRTATDTTWTPVANNGTYINYTVLDVNNDTDIFLNEPISISTPLPIMSGSPLTVTTQLGNQGPNNFNGTVQATMINVATGVSYLVAANTGQSIGPINETTGYYDTLGEVFTNTDFIAPDGTYALLIQHQYNGAGNFYTTSSDYEENPVLVAVGMTTSLTPINLNNTVLVFPNPAKDLINILPQGAQVIEVHMFDIQGREIQKQILPNGKSAIQVPVSDLSAGTYLIQVQTENDVFTRKIVITP